MPQINRIELISGADPGQGGEGGVGGAGFQALNEAGGHVAGLGCLLLGPTEASALISQILCEPLLHLAVQGRFVLTTSFGAALPHQLKMAEMRLDCHDASVVQGSTRWR